MTAGGEWLAVRKDAGLRSLGTHPRQRAPEGSVWRTQAQGSGAARQHFRDSAFRQRRERRGGSCWRRTASLTCQPGEGLFRARRGRRDLLFCSVCAQSREGPCLSRVPVSELPGLSSGPAGGEARRGGRGLPCPLPASAAGGRGPPTQGAAPWLEHTCPPTRFQVCLRFRLAFPSLPPAPPAALSYN